MGTAWAPPLTQAATGVANEDAIRFYEREGFKPFYVSLTKS